MLVKNLPTVSVIIPTYNCDRYLAQAVSSVLSQTECDYELLIIDDGSTDNTRQVLQLYQDRINYVYQNNQGVCASRNHGINLAKGEFVAFLDADDFFLPGKLAAQVAIFRAQPNLGIVHSGWRRVDIQGKTLIDICPWENIPELNLETWLRWKPVLPSAMMFRREWLKQVNGFDTKYTVAEDVDLVLRLALAGCPADWLREITVCYRQHQKSAMSNGLPQAHALSTLLDNFFAQPNLPEKIRLLEHQVRYGTLVWVSWYLYHTGQVKEMMIYLQRAWQYSNYLPVETAINWVESFAEFAQSNGENLDTDSLCKSREWRELMQWMITRPF